MTTLSSWSPYDDYVQGGMSDGRYMNAAYTLVAAGPPRLANLPGGAVGLGTTIGTPTGDNIVYPIGVVQNMNLSHNMALTRVFELGSERSYFIPGRVIGQLGLGRIMYHGPSLLRAMWAYYSDTIAPTVVSPVFANLGAATVANPHDVKIPPGYENIFLNLASDLFKQPIGLMIMFKDSNEDTMGAIYLEDCHVPNHNMGMDAMGTVIQESVSVQFERAVPVATTVVGLISA